MLSINQSKLKFKSISQITSRGEEGGPNLIDSLALLPPYLIFVRNAGNAVSVKFLAECKQIPEKNKQITALGQICRKFTHFPSVKFPGLKMCECKITSDKYQVCL